MTQTRFLIATIFTLSFAGSMTLANSPMVTPLGESSRFFLAQDSLKSLLVNRHNRPQKISDIDFHQLKNLPFGFASYSSAQSGGATSGIEEGHFRPLKAPSKTAINSPEEAPGGVLSQLNLTPTQRQQIQQIHQKYQEPIKQRLEAVALARRELGRMMVGTDSVAAIRTQHQDIAQIRQAIDELRFESLLEMRNILTLEQRQQFARIMQQRRKKDEKGGNFLSPNL